MAGLLNLQHYGQLRLCPGCCIKPCHAMPCHACHLAATGDGGHAGAQLMPLRNDASLAAAELALFVERAALGTGEGPGAV